MKTYLSSLIIALGFFVTTTASAQMPMGQMGRPGMNSRNGMDRGVGIGQYSNGKKKGSGTDDKVNPLEQSLNLLEKELALDTFQKAVIKDLMVKNQSEETLVLNQEIPKRTRSWAKWRDEAATSPAGPVPSSLTRHPEWVLPFLLTYPHRANRTLTAFADATFGNKTALA